MGLSGRGYGDGIILNPNPLPLRRLKGLLAPEQIMADFEDGKYPLSYRTRDSSAATTNKKAAKAAPEERPSLVTSHLANHRVSKHCYCIHVENGTHRPSPNGRAWHDAFNGRQKQK